MFAARVKARRVPLQPAKMLSAGSHASLLALYASRVARGLSKSCTFADCFRIVFNARVIQVVPWCQLQLSVSCQTSGASSAASLVPAKRRLRQSPRRRCARLPWNIQARQKELTIEMQTPKRGRGRKVVDESDEEEQPAPKKSTPKKPTKKREPTPVEESTTTSDYFGTSKPKRSAANTKSTPTKATVLSTRSTPNGRSAKKQIAEDDRPVKKLDDDDEKAEDVFASEFKSGKRGGDDDYEEGSDVNMEDADDDFVVPDDEDDAKSKGKGKDKKAPAKPTKNKRKSPDTAADEDEEATPKKAKKAPAKKATPKKKAADEPENAAAQAIFDSIPLVRPPTPPSKTGDGTSKKFNPYGAHANSGPAPAAGSKEIPVGAENCLAGLSFVFTGIQQSLGRDEGQALVKRYGGKTLTAPSSKTSYVVLGSDAGPKKLETIEKHGLKTIDEDGLFELIRRLPANGGDSKAASAHAEKKKAEEEKIRREAEEAEAEEKKAAAAKAKAAASKATVTGKAVAPQPSGADNRLWTVKHAPTKMEQICGNKGQVEKLQRWLRSFPKNQRTGFKMPGPDGSGVYRAIMIHGPPGIGKTTAAHLIAKLEGYDIVESNASDTRSKKLVEQGLKGVLSTTSLNGYFAADGAQVESSKKKLVLIMDEVDGMSAGDRGGVGALAAVCKKTQVPMILICNDRRLPKMKPFDFVTFDLGFRRPTTEMIRSRIMTIGFREGIKLPAPVVDALIEGSGADIRQVVNMLSTAKQDQALRDGNMDFEDSKKMSKAWEKHVILKPWDIVSKILAGGMFASSSKKTLNDKAELYFNDHEFSYLMLQENYLGSTSPQVSALSGKHRTLKALELAEKAANSISEGDLIDRMIHGQEQHWSLMPAHAIFSFVRPASFVAGSMAGHRTQFTQWLGKNSSYGKSMRQIKEIQGHMRLHSSGDRHEIRQQYVPLLWDRLCKRLETDGKDCVSEVIDLMDSYFLTKEDHESLIELGVGFMDQEKLKIESQTKSSFTRLYNQANHPLPFMKASQVIAPKSAPKIKPDLEEALEESDEGEEIKDPEEIAKDEEKDNDLSKDKYVKQPKKKKAPAAKKGKGKAKADGDDDDDEDEAPKPKKGKAKAKAKK
ncbi:hypothetical protein FH972_023238 [Carpinus fangiana]|uniref:Replication factor C subunit 1 n=1 Tax=Carpinus fangiana TaxID=176857 RepID=A0A5N6KV35_9ROSI|nr:hypothetical protein FH972_023238 [Carpinus fangiana]